MFVDDYIFIYNNIYVHTPCNVRREKLWKMLERHKKELLGIVCFDRLLP